MAAKPQKQAVETTTPPELVAQSAAPLITEINLEDAIADELLDSIDWQKVKVLMLSKAKAKFWQWIAAATPDTDINLALQGDAIAISASEVKND